MKFVAIPEPTLDPAGLRDATMALKQTVEILAGVRGGKINAAVTWQDLVNLGLITQLQVPLK